MGIISFSVFRKKLETGIKAHTIRFRKEPPIVGEAMALWWKSRTKERKLIGVTIVTRVDAITIDPENRDVIINEILLKTSDIEALSFKDGFESINDFWEYFKDGKRSGFLIHWDPDYITHKAILPWVVNHAGFLSERPKQRREYTPSSGTEGLDFTAKWCEQCDRDKDQKCSVLMSEMNCSVLITDDKGQWFKHENKAFCAVFKPKKSYSLTARIAASKRAQERKGQLNLLTQGAK